MAASSHKKLALMTVGCRLNQYETERMGAALYPHGFRRADPGEPADLYIINTCTVTHRADSSSRYLVQKAARENPRGRIVVAGCYVDSDAARLEAMQAVDIVIPNRDKSRIAEILPARFPELFDRAPGESSSTPQDAFKIHNRVWLKVSDGCNQRCAFCILPQVRGPLRNRPVRDLITEVNEFIGLGFSEVVLTGVNLGHYQNRQTEPQVRNLAHLCRIILAETDIVRIRLSSLEPQTVRDELLQVCAESGGRICRHMHLPLQSGSDRLLRLMRRPYRREIYLQRVADARRAQPNTTVGADVIVGFPGETDDDFQQTREAVESGLIDYLHVFSYSDRPGTQAAELPGKVAPDTIRERNAILSGISERLLLKAHQRQIGQTLDVIAEHHRPVRRELFGVSDNYLKVRLPYDHPGGRTPIRVRVTGADLDCVWGDVLD